MEDIKAIDIMNYPSQCKGVVEYDFSEHEEWANMAKTTFAPFFPLGRFPANQEELKQHKHLYGTLFYPYESVDVMLKAMDENGYDKMCMVAVKMWSYRNHKMIFDFNTEQVNELVKMGKGRIIGVAGYNPFNITESLQNVEKAVKEYGFKFVYVHTMGFGIHFNDRKMYPLYGLCSTMGIPVSLQVGHSAEPLPSWVGNPMSLDEVVMDFPDLKINLSHTGFPWIKEWIDLVWKHPNVYGDISAYNPKSLDRELISFMTSGRGNRKVMWGSNGIGLGRGRQQLLEMEMKDNYKRNILRDNALRFMGMEDEI